MCTNFNLKNAVLYLIFCRNTDYYFKREPNNKTQWWSRVYTEKIPCNADYYSSEIVQMLVDHIATVSYDMSAKNDD